MANKYLDYDGLLYFWQKIKTLFVSDVTYDSSSKKIQKTKAGSTSDVVTLSTVATSGAYSDLSGKPTIPTLKNVFGKVKVGTTTIEADTTQDTLELVAGTNVTLTPDATDDKVTVSATDSTYSLSKDGETVTLTGSGGDSSSVTLNPYDALPYVVTDSGGNSYSGLTLSYVFHDTSYTANLASVDLASTTSRGLMSPSDKTKLDGIATGAEVNQNAFSIVKVGSTIIAADDKTDTLKLVGNNVTLTPDATNDKVTIGITASNVTTALGTTAVSRATGDASGNNIASTYAPKASPALSGTPTAPTAAAGTNTTQIATTEFVTSAVQTAITGSTAFQGIAPTSFAPTNYKRGYYWVVGTAGTYVGETCEAGDMIFCIADYVSSYNAADFNVVQTNLDITSITNAEIDTIVAA